MKICVDTATFVGGAKSSTLVIVQGRLHVCFDTQFDVCFLAENAVKVVSHPR